MNRIKAWAYGRYGLMLFAAVLVVIVSIIKYKPGEINYYNSDATWHTLLTIQAYDETPIAEHLFLPIVSLGGQDDKYIPWGATVLGREGNYYYTSFSAAGYFLPWLFMKIFRLPVAESSLYIYNSLLFAVSAVLWTWFLGMVYAKSKEAMMLSLVGMLTYIFSPELFHGMGVVYWHHSVMQVTLLVQVIAFYKMRRFCSRKAGIVFYLMAFINPYIEWTGYVANIGFALVGIIINWKSDRQKEFGRAYILGVLTVMSFGTFMFHYFMRVDVRPFWEALRLRFTARTGSGEALFTDLAGGYFQSFLYLWALLLGLVIWNFVKSKKITLRNGIWIFVLAFPGLENVIMINHALMYTYDRMKFAFLLSLLICELSRDLLPESGNRTKTLIGLLAGVILACGLNLKSYVTNDAYVWETDYREKNRILADYINENYGDSVLSATGGRGVRGYLCLLFDRGIYEEIAMDELEKMAVSDEKRYAVALILDNGWAWNLSPINEAYIYDVQTEAITRVSVLDGTIQTTEQQYYLSNDYQCADVTDANWTNGCSNTGNILLFNRQDELLLDCLVNEQIVTAGEVYHIEDMNYDDQWIRVFVDKDTTECRYPADMQFRRMGDKK